LIKIKKGAGEQILNIGLTRMFVGIINVFMNVFVITYKIIPDRKYYAKERAKYEYVEVSRL